MFDKIKSPTLTRNLIKEEIGASRVLVHMMQ
jgi:hypothetical protein